MSAVRYLCPLCGGEVTERVAGHTCPHCGAPARARSVPVFFAAHCPPQALRERLPALLFSPARERKPLAALFPHLTAVTLYGNYGDDVMPGVDARDLSRFADASFSAHLSIILFDYFTEHERALAEAFRVLAPGGLFATLILDGRIRGGAPHVVKTLEKKPGYYDYWPDGVDILSIGVGASWLAEAMRAAGFADAAHVAIPDPISGYVSHWFVGTKPAGLFARLAQRFRRRTAPLSCPICKTAFPPGFDGGDCPACGAPARVRSLPQAWKRIGPISGKLLGFALTGAERDFLAPRADGIVSVSLYGDYGAGHIAGVDVRDLSRFEAGSFACVFALLLFDYFPEHEQALAEIARVLKSGGVLATAILESRLGEDDAPPVVTKIIEAKPGYFDYVPAETPLVSIRVGRRWFLAAVERAGFAAETVTITDPASRTRTTWFIGRKR